MSMAIAAPMTANSHQLVSTTCGSDSARRRIASLVTRAAAAAMITDSPSAARFSARRCPYGCSGSAGRAPSRTATSVRTAAMTSPLDSTPAETSARLPVARPVPSLSATSTHAATIDARAVRAPRSTCDGDAIAVTAERSGCGERSRQLDEETHAEAAAALGGVGAARLVRRPCDVQVHPRHLAGELAQELRGDDRAGLARLVDVDDVRGLALEQVGVVGVQRQPPGELARAHAGVGHRLRPRVVVGEQAAVRGAERGYDRAGERREVDEPLGAERDGVREAVREDEAALGVGVEHLDGR